jgi:hypothetical protein
VVISLGYLIPLILHKIISSSGGITCTRGCFFILPLSITGWACKGMVYNLLQQQLQVHVYKCVEWTRIQISHVPDYSECTDWMSLNCRAHITERWSIIYLSFIFISANSYSLSNIMFKWSTFDVFTLYWAHYTMNLFIYFQFLNYFIRNSVIMVAIC